MVKLLFAFTFAHWSHSSQHLGNGSMMAISSMKPTTSWSRTNQSSTPRAASQPEAEENRTDQCRRRKPIASLRSMADHKQTGMYSHAWVLGPQRNESANRGPPGCPAPLAAWSMALVIIATSGVNNAASTNWGAGAVWQTILCRTRCAYAICYQHMRYATALDSLPRTTRHTPRTISRPTGASGHSQATG